MNVFEQLISKLTDSTQMMVNLHEFLGQVDVAYPQELQLFQESVQTLAAKFGENNLRALLAAENERFAANFIILICNGIYLNMECFCDPGKKSFLQQDYEEILQERKLNRLPVTVTAIGQCRDIYRQLPEELTQPMETVISYYCYLETVAYKVAHYFGFLLGDKLLYHLVPGYVHNQRLTDAYYEMMQNYLTA